MKKCISLILLVFVLCLVGCSGVKISSANDAKKYYNDTIKEFKDSNSAEFRLTLASEDDNKVIYVGYSFKDNQIESLSAQLTDKNGIVSLYIKDGYEYLSRYNNPKVRQAVTTEETNKIISEYKIDAFILDFLCIFGDSFFDASEVKKIKKDQYLLVCNPFDIEIPDDITKEEEKIYEGLSNSEKAELSLYFKNNKVVKADGVIVNENGDESSLTLELISTSFKLDSIPNADAYTTK